MPFHHATHHWKLQIRESETSFFSASCKAHYLVVHLQAYMPQDELLAKKGDIAAAPCTGICRMHWKPNIPMEKAGAGTKFAPCCSHVVALECDTPVGQPPVSIPIQNDNSLLKDRGIWAKADTSWALLFSPLPQLPALWRRFKILI